MFKIVTGSSDQAKELVSKEELEEGDVSLGSYIYFAKAIGYARLAVTLFFNIAGSTGVTSVVSGFILAAWTAAVGVGHINGLTKEELGFINYKYLSYCM